MIGKAIAHEGGATFFSISSSSLTSKWIGQGEKLVKTLYAVADYRSPSVIFIDEIDSLLTQRKSDENEASRRIKTEFLTSMDGGGNEKTGQVLTIGATNLPWELDDAALRRFVKKLYIPLPDELGRESLVRNLLSKNLNTVTDKEIAKITQKTKGYSGADLRNLFQDASLGPVRDMGSMAADVPVDQLPPISYKHCKISLRSMGSSVKKEDLAKFEDWEDKYGNKVQVNNCDSQDESSDEDSES